MSDPVKRLPPVAGEVRRPPGTRTFGPCGSRPSGRIVDAMFARYYAEVSRPFEDVERALLDEPQGWLPGLARDAEARGEHLLVSVGFGSSGHRVEKQVAVELGTPLRMPSKAVLPMTWTPVVAERLFPALEADVEVAFLGANRTQVAISARYRPPLGAMGRTIDKALLHRVAEATVKDFLDRVTERLRSTPVPLAG
jgi:hypothetical protein